MNQSHTPTWDEVIDKILNNLTIGQEAVPQLGHAAVRIFISGKEEAKAAINAAVLEHVIGEDEDPADPDAGKYERVVRQDANMIRAEQRKVITNRSTKEEI